MIRKLFTACLVLGLTISFIGCASGKKKQKIVADDQLIVSTIKQEILADSGPKGPLSIDLDSHRGVVTLEGTVPSEDVKNQVISIVGDVQGVESVQSYLLVQPE